jgi:hypothetical protein
MNGQMGVMPYHHHQVQQGGMVMQQPGYQPQLQVSQHQQPPGMTPVPQGDTVVGPHVKKPLNAFMLYMKEMRQAVVKECTLKESAAINQILGRKVSCNCAFWLPATEIRF